MKLIGMLDSPYVRRTAISLRRLGIAFEHRPLSVFRDEAAFRELNPLVKAPTLILDDGTVLCESGLIIDYAETLTGHSLLPLAAPARALALRRIGLAMVACEKTVQWVYETQQRPSEAQYAPWQDRIARQLQAALQAMEAEIRGLGPHNWLGGPEPGQADISMAVAWAFHQHIAPAPTWAVAQACPALGAWAERAEQRAEFKAFPLL